MTSTPKGRNTITATKARNNISRLILKAIGIFGGVQAVGIICSIIRTKLVAIWLGPVGVGLFGLFNNALEMLNTATNLGIRSSSVRDISQALDRHDSTLVGRIIGVVRRWSLWLGLGGALLTLILAPLLSQWTFGSPSYLWGFVALSAAVLLMAVTNGEQAVLQGTAQLKRLANVSLWGTILGLAVSVPLFYWLRERSVIPSIIAYALANALMAFLLRDRKYPHQTVSRRETAAIGAGFVKLGIYMTVGTFVTILMGYVFNAWLNQHDGTTAVGHYQAGYTLINKYTGLILAALGMEYFPRLSRVATHRSRLRIFVSQEINITLLVMAPVIAWFIVLRDPIVRLLYSTDFLVVEGMITWGIVGTAMRALSWCMAFVILAKGDGPTYVVTESLSAVLGLALNIVCYLTWGLTGLGIAFTLWYLAYVLIVGCVYFFRYKLTLSPATAGSVLWVTAVAVGMMLLTDSGHLIAAGALAFISLIFSGWMLYKQWAR